MVLLALLAVTPGCDGSFANAVRILYVEACPRQTGVDASVFDPLRVSVVRGRVVSEDGAPLAGVRITVPRERRYGETRTGADGSFAFVLNGGARARLRFEADGRLVAPRSADAKSNRFLVLDDIALVTRSGTASSLSFGGGGWQVATGDVGKARCAHRVRHARDCLSRQLPRVEGRRCCRIGGSRGGRRRVEGAAPGRVVALVAGAARSLDTNGDGVADSPAELAALGITPEESAKRHASRNATRPSVIDRADHPTRQSPRNGFSWPSCWKAAGPSTTTRR